MPGKRSQRGIFTVVTALSLVALIGSVGLAIDLSRFQVVRAELQSAADACALAAVMELNGMTDGPARAEKVGLFIGGKNSKNFQTESAAIGLTVTFSETASGSYSAAGTVPPSARFARCVASEPGLRNLFMGVLGNAQSDVAASSVATVRSSSSVCALPIAVCSKAAGNFSPGDLISMPDQGTPLLAGFFGWANVNGQLSNNSDYKGLFIFSGACEAPTVAGSCIGVDTGAKTTIDEGWNTRLGAYKTAPNTTPAEFAELARAAPPDLTGAPVSTVAEYATAALARASGPKVQGGGYNPAPSLTHQTYGMPFRRLVPIPVVECASTCGAPTGAGKQLKGWACVLMANAVSPSGSAQPYQVIYLGDASAADSPCRTTGTPGGTGGIGPLVPTLIQ